ncbi:MAG TPA: ATP-binding protein [Gemmatimonadales bacterium]|jgi:signal transduction histidine kinase|nr:ATP-binding protein [Gemmatimonadales bacterium]
MSPSLIDDLRRVPLLANLTDDQLGWLAELGIERVAEAGEAVIRPGERADAMVIMLEGMIEARQPPGQPSAPTFYARAGDITGVLPFSRMATYTRAAVALVRTRMLSIPVERFPDLFQRIPTLEAPLVGVLIDRVRRFARLAEQGEKRLALGRFAAGLAHELNNPASAARRGTAEARDRVDRLSRLAGALACTDVDPGVFADLDRLRDLGIRNRREAQGVDPLDRSDAEERMADWLLQLGVSEPWVAAGTLVDARLGPDELDPVLARLSAEARPIALDYLEAHLSAAAALATAQHATSRIAALVEAAKEHTQMDRVQDVVPVDVRVGLDSTLALYAGRLADKGVAVSREYAEPLSPVRGYPGSLNEVWAQLLANAMEAVESGTGRIRVGTRGELDRVIVEVADNGPGVPPELQERIWEPFFTTRPGRHTGLGLDIAHRIIVDEHGGQIDLTCETGETCVTVRLPVGGLVSHVV